MPNSTPISDWLGHAAIQHCPSHLFSHFARHSAAKPAILDNAASPICAKPAKNVARRNLPRHSCDKPPCYLHENVCHIAPTANLATICIRQRQRSPPSFTLRQVVQLPSFTNVTELFHGHTTYAQRLIHDVAFPLL